MAFKSRIGKFSRIGRSSKSPLMLTVFAIFFAGIGAYAIINSRAATTLGYGNVSFHLTDEMTGAGIAGVDLRIRATNDAQYCATPYATSNGNGDITFTNCSLHLAGPSDHYYVYYNSAPGYSYSSRPAGNYNAYDNLVTGNNGTKYITYYNFPSATISASPSSVAYGASSNITFRGYYSDRCQFRSGQNNPGNVNPGSTFNTGALTASQTYTLYCYSSSRGWNSADASATVTVGAPPVPSANLSASATSVSSGGRVRFAWSSSNATACRIEGTNIAYNTGTLASTSNGGYIVDGPPQTTSATYRAYCWSGGTGINGNYSSLVTVGITQTGGGGGGSTGGGGGGSTGGGGSGGGSGTTVKVSTSGGSRTVARATTAPANSSDKEKPSMPENFKAEQFGSGEVDLSWDEATDNVAVAGYTLERTTDQKEWTMLDDAVVDTYYTDTTADYNVAYTYRLSSKDTGGNFSDYAVVDITTNDFTANVTADEDSTITSDDGIVEVTIPAGALSEDAFCEISKDSVSRTPKGYKLVAGAYSVSCRNAAGDSIDSFDKELKVTMHLKSSAKRYGKFAAYGVGDSLSTIPAAFNSKTGDLTFNLKELQAFAAFGAKKGSMWWIWILLLLLIVGLVFLVKRLRNGGSGDDYYDTTDYVSMPPSAPVGPLDTGANGYQHHPSLPELVAQGGQPQQPGQQPPGPSQQQPPYPPQQPPLPPLPPQ